MFERFTDRARRVLVLAQEESRLLDHSFIGTEHILLGLIREGDGIAAQALTQMGFSIEAAREKVEEIIGALRTERTGPPPFTPRAKKVLEFSLREALQMGHSYIGTRHLLLGLVREGEGVGAQVLISLGADLAQVRETVIRILKGQMESETAVTSEAQEMNLGGWIVRGGTPRRTRTIRCSFCGREQSEAGRLIAGGDAYICRRCVDELSKDKSGAEDKSDEQ